VFALGAGPGNRENSVVASPMHTWPRVFPVSRPGTAARQAPPRGTSASAVIYVVEEELR
jgi:hypothetical protein